MLALKPCANPWCGKEHRRPKYCSEECYLKANREQRKKNAKRYRAKYRGCYRAACSPSVAPKREMCKCPDCQKMFLGSPWQGYHSYCDDCAGNKKGISFEPYRIGSGWSNGYREEANYYA
jgi:hypothetical protein